MPTTVCFISLEMGSHTDVCQSYHWQPLRTELKGVHYPSLLASEDTQTHSSLKRPISGVYAMSNVVKSESYINENIHLLVKKLHKEYVEGEDGNKVLSVFQWMHYCKSIIAYHT